MKRQTAAVCLSFCMVFGSADLVYGNEGEALDCVAVEIAFGPDGQMKVHRASDEIYPEGASPDVAAAFGQKIKKYVREEDAVSLFSLASGELEYGPRKGFIRGKKFHDVFSAQWRSAILKAPCQPIWSRGYGQYIFYCLGEMWSEAICFNSQIVRIYGALKEKFPQSKILAGWKIREGLIPPQCLAVSCTAICSGEEASILHSKIPVDLCFFDRFYDGKMDRSTRTVDIKREGKLVTSKICISDDSCNLQYSYKIVAEVPVEKCQRLASESMGKCLESNLIYVTRDTGGSAGPDRNFNIYGLFASKDKKRYIVPLKQFFTRNDALSFIDTMGK